MPRSEYWQVPALPPPVLFAEPPPVPDEVQVLGPALLPPWKPPLEIPSQQVPKPAHAPGQAWAPSWQRLLTQRRELTGGPERHSQYQYGQSSGALQNGAFDDVVPPPLDEVPPPVPERPPPLPERETGRQLPSEQVWLATQETQRSPLRPH